MSSENSVKAFPLVYGTAGTQSAITGNSTATSQVFRMPKEDYTIQLTVGTTGTSGYLASVVFQESVDNIGWFTMTSATASATSASAAATVTNNSSVVIAVTARRAPFTRALGTYTGTGSAVLTMAF